MSDTATQTLAAYSQRMIMAPLLSSGVLVGGFGLVPPDLLAESHLKDLAPVIACILLTFFWYLGLRVQSPRFRLGVHVLKTIVLPLLYNISLIALLLVFQNIHSIQLTDLNQDWQVFSMGVVSFPILYLLIREHIRCCLDTPRILRFMGWLFLPFSMVVQGSPPLMAVVFPVLLLVFIFLLIMPYGKYIRWFIYPPPILPPIASGEGQTP